MDGWKETCHQAEGVDHDLGSASAVSQCQLAPEKTGINSNTAGKHLKRDLKVLPYGPRKRRAMVLELSLLTSKIERGQLRPQFRSGAATVRGN
ncbi:hypothetical protein D3C73_671150 [compost metagenome]